VTAAQLKIIEQVRKDGTTPARTDWRTMANLQNSGLIHFSAKHGLYKIGPEPKEK
jgi:hypothetical protein